MSSVYNALSMPLPNKIAWVVFLFSVLLCPQLSVAHAEAISGLSDPELEALARLPEDQINIGNLALVLATEAFPNLDVSHYSAQLDAMVDDIRRLTGGSTDPDYRIRVMNTYLYLDKGFHYDKGDMYGHQPTNRYLSGILDTKAGSCTTMPLLYLAIAQRLGYPVYPVAAPQHLFLRYIDPKLNEQNIEATGGGGFTSDEEYTVTLEIPEQGIKSGTYLKTMTYRQLLGDLITENGTYWANQGNLHRAIQYLQLGVHLNPNAGEAFRLLAHAYRMLAERESEQQAALQWLPNTQNILLIRQHYQAQVQGHQRAALQAMELAQISGVAPPLRRNYWMRQAELTEAYRSQFAKQGGRP